MVGEKMSEENSRKCKDCQAFDPNGVDGQSFGTIHIDGQEIPLGVCRTKAGLIFGKSGGGK